MATSIPLEERFWAKVERTDGCWVWRGAVAAGYGYFGIGNHRTQLAHRWAYEAVVGPIPSGLVIDHLCRNKACVNPAHLDAVPQRENVRRGLAGETLRRRHAAVTQCPRGHAYDEVNTYRDKRGHRACRECTRIRQRKS